MSDNAKTIFVDQPFSRQCEVCGAVFQTTALHARYCSDKCKRQREQEIRRQKRAASGAASIGQTVACAFCGKEFVRKSQSQRYCSEQCKRAQEAVVRKQKQTELKPANGIGKIFHLSIKGKCKFCGKEFEKKDIVELFCCKACEKSYNVAISRSGRGKERRLCCECGHVFYTDIANQKFCSLRCRSVHEKKLQKMRRGETIQPVSEATSSDNNFDTANPDIEDSVLEFLHTPDARKDWAVFESWDEDTRARYYSLWRRKNDVLVRQIRKNGEKHSDEDDENRQMTSEELESQLSDFVQTRYELPDFGADSWLR